ncbi:MAG: hypothetical protein EXS59_01825 [Candidatus Taylorbacteria bacterium]|nr:hypothetical protein [Candidatus Taylorbacteria bacterium]
MVLRYALKRDGVLDSETARTLEHVYQREHDLEKRESESETPSPKSEVKRVVIVVLPRWIARFIPDKV